MTRILLVDDVKLFRHLESSILGWRGYTIEEAASGNEALEKIRENPPDLVLVDLYMPGMSGLDVCQQVKKDPALRTIPIIIVTSSGRDEDIRKAIQAGCDDYLTKPLEDATLIRKVEDLLGEADKRRFPRVPTSMQISFEDFKGIFFEYTRDISRTGIFVEMAEPLPVGSQLRLSFSLPPPFGHPVLAYGRVVRSVAEKEGRAAGMGISFIHLKEDSERIIDALVASQAEYEESTGIFSRLSYQEDSQAAEPLVEVCEPRITALCEERDEARISFTELQREHMRMSAVLTLVTSLHVDSPPKMLMAVALDILSDLVGASACGILLADPTHEHMIPANSRGLPASVLDHIPNEGPIRQALAERTLQVPTLPWQIPDTTSKILAATPILFQKQVLGVVTVHQLFPQKGKLTAHDHRLLTLLGQHLGLSLINSVARHQAADNLGIPDILKVSGFGR